MPTPVARVDGNQTGDAVIGTEGHSLSDISVGDVLDDTLMFYGSNPLVVLESGIVRTVNPVGLRMLGLAEGTNPIGAPLEPW